MLSWSKTQPIGKQRAKILQSHSIDFRLLHTDHCCLSSFEMELLKGIASLLLLVASAFGNDGKIWYFLCCGDVSEVA